MELADLRAFVEAANSGTFTAAARKLHTTQPALSRRIARLEEAIGGPVFDRSNRRSPRLAPLGEAILPHARQLLGEYERFQSLVRAHTGGGSGVLTVALSDFAASFTVPLLYRYVRERVPGLQLHLLTRPPGPGVRDALQERQAELGLLDPAF